MAEFSYSKGGDPTRYLFPYSHPQPQSRRAVGPRAKAVGSLNFSVGLTQVINLRN
ncbi:MAG TPA: hypothetical protein VF831_03375 [Anaerolineales bacterium]